MYKLAVFDIDGTLTVSGNDIPETTIEAIGRLRGRGIECLIATGRERENLPEILEKTGIENYVACNGHYVKHEGKTIYRYTYPEDILQRVKDICQREGYYYGFSNGEGLYLSDMENLRKEEVHPLLNRVKIIDEIQGDVENILLYAGDGGEHFKELEGEHRLGPWGNGMFDLIKNDRSKAVGIDEIARRLGIERSRIITFGDGLNDLEMTEYAGLGVAMGNAKEELKLIADHVTDRVEDDGIMKACIKYGLI